MQASQSKPPSAPTMTLARALRCPAVAGCMALALLSCASLAPQTQQCVAPIWVEVPSAWSTGDVSSPNGNRLPAQWWQRFGDDALTRLEAQAQQANTSVKGAQAALRQARAVSDVAAAALWPTLSLSAAAQHNTAGHESRGNQFQVGLDAGWELDIFGVNRQALAASEANAEANAASLGDVRVSIAAEVALDYFALRSAQARLAIAADNLATQAETLQITQWREQAGLVTNLESEQARAQTEQTRAQIPVLQTAVEQSRHALAVLTGQPPAALSGTLSVAAPIPHAADDLALSLPAETLRQRPDVRAAELQVTAALARVAQADAARLPNFRLGGSLGLNAATVGALGNGASVVSSLLANVAMPLFDGGALRAQVRVQQAALEQARSAYQAAVLKALQEVEDALIALRGDRERLGHLQQAASAATNAAQLARLRYASGLVDFQTVLDTQRTQLGAQDSVAVAGADLGADHVRLYKALGGGWQPDAAAHVSANAVHRDHS